MGLLKIISWRYRDLLFNVKLFTPKSLLKYYAALFSGKQLLHIQIKGIERRFWVRVRNRIDRNVLEYVFLQKYHLPPKEVQLKSDAIIIDLGSNIGCTLVDFKMRYPKAKVFGYEMHPNNFEIAKANIHGLDGVKVFNEAVWTNRGYVSFNKKNLTDAFAIGKDLQANDDTIQIPSVSILDIIETNKIPEVDFLKMDIEGAELDILDFGDISWLNKVKSLNIEFHNISEDKLNSYVQLLKQYKFTVYKSPHHWLSLLAFKS